MKQKDEFWKVSKSTYLHKEPWLTVRKDDVILPNGYKIPSYYVLEYPNWVNVIAITKEKEFVFIRQYRHGLKQVNYELCAGVCEATDKSPLISAKRELLEETGYGKGKWKKYLEISPNPGNHTNMTYCFLATDVEKVSDQKLDSTEYLSVHLLKKEEVYSLLKKNKIMQALMAAPLWKYMYETNGMADKSKGISNNSKIKRSFYEKE